MIIPLLAALSCLPVDGPKLLARHVASAVPAFSQADPEAALGFAPVPGAVRVVRPDELRRMAAAIGLDAASSAPICFEWERKALTEEEAEGSMRKALPAEAKLEILDISRFPVPPGEVHFPLEGLKAGMWRGHVTYAGDKRFAVWARVRVDVAQTRVVAAVAIKGGETLTAEDLRVEQLESAPGSDYVARLEDAVGLVAKRAFAPGSPLPLQMLEQPAAVKRGDMVRLHARIGMAHVTTQAQAQAAGKVGEWIPVRNPGSGKVLRARIESAGEVALTQ